MSEQSGLNASPPRSRRRLILGVALLLVVVVFATVLVTSRMTGREGGSPTTTTAPEEPTAPTTAGQTTNEASAAGADGCLGGINPSKAVLRAQEEAALDPRGAAAMAATFFRWRGQYPQGTDYEDVAERVFTEDAGEELLTRDAETEAGTGWADMSDGRYAVTQSDKESATVELVATGYAQQGDEESTAIVWGQIRMRASDGKWQVADVDSMPEGDMEAVRAEGHPFKGGC
ncbi:hypothetical protein GCM10022199_27740 [Marihabitans asiaticum]|uniref:Uncharacterized protein n=1 Tax=Marihabitans asiaticum TaxID=415218 RepID=A0A560W626_9MICO|nr:hypothetical protein [Marihabitans asiaticum]TWD13071.1 hypothetical protein FB557_2838 [Marihabitans asiaticum]